MCSADTQGRVPGTCRQARLELGGAGTAAMKGDVKECGAWGWCASKIVLIVDRRNEQCEY